MQRRRERSETNSLTQGKPLARINCCRREVDIHLELQSIHLLEGYSLLGSKIMVLAPANQTRINGGR